MSAEKIWNYLKSQGMTDYGVAGLMGNLQAESGLSPINLQNTYNTKLGMSDAAYTAAVDNGTYTNFINDAAGYGLAQWTWHTRKKALLNYSKDKNKSIGDLDTQLEFLMKELNESYKSVLNTLKIATTVRQASDVVLLKFEVPYDQSESVKQKRATLGQNFYNQFAAGTVMEGGQNMTIDTATKIFSKGKKVQLSDHFVSTEFDCQGGSCCSQTTINGQLIKYLQQIRDHFGQPITITSGYRCNKHNSNVGGASGSRHTRGDAADFIVKNTTPAEVAKYAESIGVLGIGLYPNFVHIDTRTTKSFWYNHSQEYRSTFGGTPITTEENTKTEEIISTPTVEEVNTTPSDYEFKVGDEIKLIAGSKYIGDIEVPSWVIKKTLYVREVRSNGNLVISIYKDKGITGIINPQYAVLKSQAGLYSVKVTADVLNVRAKNSTASAVVAQVKKGDILNILKVNGQWGQINQGWIFMKYVSRV